jgi:hypothetical protein
MTKQKVEASANNERVLLPHEEPLTRELLFRSQILTDKIISEVKRRNDEEFGSVEVIDFWGKMNSPNDRPTKKVKSSATFVDDSETWQHNKKMRFLKAAANRRTGKFYSLESLVESGAIAESEKQFFDLPPGIVDYPFRSISTIFRIKKLDGSERISTIEQWVGISATGSVVTCPVMDALWYIRPKITYEPRTVEGVLLPRGDNITEQITKRAAIIKTTGYLGEVIGEKVFTHEWNEEIFRSCLNLARGGIQSVGDSNNGCALTLIRENDSHGTSAKTIEDFLLPFDEIWERQRSPEKIVKISSGDMIHVTKDKEGKDLYQ